VTAIRKVTRENGDVRYVSRPTIDGKKEYVCKPTKKEAEREVAQLKERAHRLRHGLAIEDAAPKPITYDEHCDKVLANYIGSDASKADYTYCLQRSRRQFGKRLITELDTETIEAWLARQPGSQQTKRKTLKRMRQALDKAVLWGYLQTNPAKAVQMPPEQPQAPQPFGSWDEVENVAAQLKSPTHRALVRFACATGLRPGEWQALRWSDIDKSAGRLTVNRTLQSGKIVENQAKTRGSLRAVELDALALAALASLAEPLDRTRLVFEGQRGVHINLAAFRRGLWAKALEAAGVEHRTPYAMRDTRATFALNAECEPAWIAGQLGHSVTVLLKTYARWTKSGNERNLRALADFAAESGHKLDTREEAK
jgi:integrase